VQFVLFFTCFFIKRQFEIDSLSKEDLRRPCDACGKPIGGGYKHCPKCNIYLCFLCGKRQMPTQMKLPPECPVCGEKLAWRLFSTYSVCDRARKVALADFRYLADADRKGLRQFFWGNVFAFGQSDPPSFKPSTFYLGVILFAPQTLKEYVTV
jgi:hypothetical protein